MEHTPDMAQDSDEESDRRQETAENAPGTSPLAFALFIATNVVLFLRPSDLVPGAEGLPIYEPLILLGLLAAAPAVLAELTARSLRRRPVTACVITLLPVVLFARLCRGDIYSARIQGMNFLKVVLYYLLVVANLHSPGRVRMFILWLASFSMILTGLSVMSYHQIVEIPALKPYVEAQEGIIDHNTGQDLVLYRLSGVGIFDNPNDMSRLIAIGMTIAICWIVETHSAPVRLLWVAPLILLGYGLYRTASRGGFVSLLGALVPALVVRFGKKRAMLLALIIVPVLFAIFASRITDISATEGTGQGRIQLWSRGVTFFQESPLWGIGVDEYADREHIAMHNSFLQYYVELGIIGGVLFAGAYGFLLRELSRMGVAKSLVHDDELRRLHPVIIALISGYGAGLLTCNRAYMEPTYALIGLGAAYLALASDRGLWAVPEWSKRLMIEMICFGALCLITMYIYIRVMVRWGD